MTQPSPIPKAITEAELEAVREARTATQYSTREEAERAVMFMVTGNQGDQ